METLVVAKPGSTGVKPAGASVRFLVAFWFPDLGSTDARSVGASIHCPHDWPIGSGPGNVLVRTCVTVVVHSLPGHSRLKTCIIEK